MMKMTVMAKGIINEVTAWRRDQRQPDIGVTNSALTRKRDGNHQQQTCNGDAK